MRCPNWRGIPSMSWIVKEIPISYSYTQSKRGEKSIICMDRLVGSFNEPTDFYRPRDPA